MNEVQDRTGTDFDQALSEQAHRYSGAVGIGLAADTVQLDRSHDRCIAYCLSPGQRRRGVRCPSCYRQVAIRSINGEDIPPAGTRFAWIVGGLLGALKGGWESARRDMIRTPAATGWIAWGVICDGLPGDVPPGDGRDGHARPAKGMT